ncbi:hypothetical protein CMT78_03905 [Elizabethkingia anophelis]|nr:hypothetical protein [Elizabethkingia anophelis]
MKNIFCRGILCLVIVVYGYTSAQNKPLKKGNTVPESFYIKRFEAVNIPQNSISFSKDRNKLILIDFWATWCSSCLANFPKMEALQQQFADRISIVAVTDQNRAVLEKFFSSANGKRYAGMISVTGDQFLHQLFPHKGVPYIVWIKDGKVLNTTDAEQVTEKTISEVLGGQQSSLQTVVQIDKTHPLMLSESYDAEKNTELSAYSFLSKGRIRSLDYGTWFHRDKGKTYGRQFTNLSLMEIYSALGDELFELRGEHFSAKRIINRIRKPEEIDFKTTVPGAETDSKLYSIDFIVPKTQADSLYDRMLRFINDNTAFNASLERKMTKCLILKRISDADKMGSKGGAFRDRFFGQPSELNNAPLEYLISALNANSDLTSLPVVDETGYKGKVDLRFSRINDLPDFQKELAGYGLAMEESERPLLMLILKDKQP